MRFDSILHLQINAHVFPLSCTRLFLFSSTTATGVAIETAERHASRLRDGGRKRDMEGHGERQTLKVRVLPPPPQHHPPKYPHLPVMLSPPPHSLFTYLCFHSTPPPFFLALHPSLDQKGCSRGGDGDVHRWKHW